MPNPNKILEIRFEATKSSGEVSALLLKPARAKCLLVLGHGAGAGMRHPFMNDFSERLADHGIATFRYQFPYMEKKSKRPDPQPVLLATVRSAVDAAAGIEKDLPLFAGGKSMGGRMTSLAAAKSLLPEVRGLIFFGFPLHPPGRPSTERAQHLTQVSSPMLFLQGSRDKLAELNLLRPVCESLAARATLHVIDGADHSFHVPKTSGRSDSDIMNELVKTADDWISKWV